jgi:CheY-like chemotaxis protein
MERIRGISLETYLEQREGGHVAKSEALDLLVRLAEALAAVHDAGISHRDVKPANIMIAAADRLVLMDFGLFQPEFHGQSSLGVGGSPVFMAPEVIARTITRGAGYLADLYAMGVIGYELLTGATPFTGDTLQEVLDGHLHLTAPRVSETWRGVPLALDRLIGDLLAKSPHDRPQSAEVVAWQLRALRGQVMASAPATRFSVLIVHRRDEAGLAQAVKRALPYAEVATVRNGTEAIQWVGRTTPAVLVLDLDLPEMSGVELVMYLRGSAAAELTIIAMSAKASAEDLQLLARLGVRSCFPKCPELSSLVTATLRELADARQ